MKSALIIVALIGLCLLRAVLPAQAGHATTGRTFVTFLQRHPGLERRCGVPVANPAWRGASVTQQYKRCHIRATFTATGSTPPTPAPTATAPPTSTPTPQPLDDRYYELTLMNAERASHGYGPLVLDAGMSDGVGGCMGAVGHAQSMAGRQTIGHWDFPGDVCGYPTLYQNAGENVGMAAYGSTRADLDQIQAQMLAEPWSPGCNGNHHCNMDNPTFRRVGIGIVPGIYAGLAATYLSVEFAG